MSGLPAEGETYPTPMNGSEFQGSNGAGINVQSQVRIHFCFRCIMKLKSKCHDDYITEIRFYPLHSIDKSGDISPM